MSHYVLEFRGLDEFAATIFAFLGEWLPQPLQPWQKMVCLIVPLVVAFLLFKIGQSVSREERREQRQDRMAPLQVVRTLLVTIGVSLFIYNFLQGVLEKYFSWSPNRQHQANVDWLARYMRALKLSTANLAR